jgi:citrate lyase subunit beta/citryl-CoA lyase
MSAGGESPRLRRSFLFVPASEERKLAKAPSLAADAVILDLEDGVAAARKAEARALLQQFLPAQHATAIEWLVRLNAFDTPYFEADLEAALRAGPHALVLPKVESADILRQVDDHLTAAEHALGREPGTVKLFALIERARGLLAAQEIAAASPRLQGLMLGHVDLCADLGITAGAAGGGILLHARCQLVLAARAADLDAVDTIYLNVKDAEGLRAEAEQAVELGFAGKLAIHPGQLPVIHEAFTPDAARLARAERILEAWRQAQAEGCGVCALDGFLIERPVVEAEQRVLRRARRPAGS